MDPELLSMMPASIGVKHVTSRDAWGNPTYGATTTYKGRIENRRRKVINRDGQEVISETALYLATTAMVDINAQITLPSGYYPTSPKIISIKRETDEYGAYSTTIYV